MTKPTSDNLTLDEMAERLDQLRQLLTAHLNEIFELRADCLSTLEAIELRISDCYGLLDKVTALYAKAKLLAEQEKKNKN